MTLNLAGLKKRIQAYRPDADLDLIDRAYEFGLRAHAGQHRSSGEDFFQHPLAVAHILAELELDVATVAAALLHDVVEDSEAGPEDLRRRFGDEVARLVDGVTKLGKLKYRTPVEQQAENLRKMFLAMAEDVRVILIKLADRLHNMRTLIHLTNEKQLRISRETLEIFAPLAHRLGIFRLKWELEDLALRYMEPEKYRELVELVPRKRAEREAHTQQVIETLRKRLRETGMEADIHGRSKHFYSIYRKMKEQGKEISEIYDLLAVRVIVNSVKDCYGVLGVVHALWKPIPGRFKDFIAMPKSNMYQSLHTTVIGPRGEPFEIQIRTREMHRTAEYGIAAHWRYKEGGRGDADLDRKLAWLRQVLEWQYDSGDAREFVESLRIDIFSDEVFVFTPKGDVIDLPAGSTPIDFAYRIHTEVGHRCVGAKVNGKIVPIDHQLRNGDIVEIITSKQRSGPSDDWINIVKTSTARSRIRTWFKRQKHEENLERGRIQLEKEIRRQGFRPVDLMREEWLAEAAQKFAFQSTDDLLVAVGYGGLTPGHIVTRLRERFRQEHQQHREPVDITRLAAGRSPRRTDDGVKVKGIDNVLVRFSRCCNPVPGDTIIGYITRGRGVSIHRTDCPNMAQYQNDQDRIIDVSWDSVDANAYPVEIEVSGIDRPGLLSDVAQVVAESRTNILSAKARARKNNLASIDLVLEIRNLEQLGYLKNKIEQIRDVLSVDRVSRDHARSGGA